MKYDGTNARGRRVRLSLARRMTVLVLVFVVAGMTKLPPLRAVELTTRRADLIGKVEDKTVRAAVQKMLELDAVSHEPIFLHIDSFGGSVEAGFVLIDTIAAIESPVYAVIESKAYSMAAIIAIFCAKRYILPHATVMFHEASYGTLGEDPTNRKKMEFNVRYLDRMHRQIAARIGMAEEEYRSHIRDGWWLMAEEAVAAGVADEVVEDLSFRRIHVRKTEIKRTTTIIRHRQVDPDDLPPAAGPR